MNFSDSGHFGSFSSGPFGVDALPIPKCFKPPGVASMFHAYIGAGAIAGYGQGALVVGQGPFPFASQMYGVNNVVGSHITEGVRITSGTDLMTGGAATVASAVWKCLAATASINGKKIEIAAGKNIEIAAGKNLNIGAAKSIEIYCGGTASIDSPGLTINGRSWELYVMPQLEIAGKGFDIPHPTKKDHRLRYICLEGPEVGAYFRGTLKKSNIIELPDYWSNLVYPDSITVNLTPIGHHQELFVDKIESNKRIIVGNNSANTINCHYTVFAERITKDKLQPEYKGLTPNDYPGDNSEYILAGWDYGKNTASNL